MSTISSGDLSPQLHFFCDTIIKLLLLLLSLLLLVRTRKRDTLGRIISLLFDFNGCSVNLLNIYAPTNFTEQKVFFETLHEYFLPSDSHIIAGDFNCYENQLDKLGGYFVPVTYLSDLRSAFSLCDAWHCLHPRLSQCTWFNANFSIRSH